jgi:SHS2 domain-containing protein
MAKRFEELHHTADWSFRAVGRDLPDLYANAAHALLTREGAAARVSARETKRDVHVEGIDYEALLVNWLNELLFLQEEHREVYASFAISRLTPTELVAQIVGKPREKMDKIIKAATFHKLKIEQTKNGWQATLVVDV